MCAMTLYLISSIPVFILFSFWWRCKTKKEEFGGRVISEKKCLIFARDSKSNEYEWGKSCHLSSFSSWELLPYLLFFGDDLVFRWWHAVVGSEAAVESGAKVEARLVFHLVDVQVGIFVSKESANCAKFAARFWFITPIWTIRRNFIGWFIERLNRFYKRTFKKRGALLSTETVVFLMERVARKKTQPPMQDRCLFSRIGMLSECSKK